VRLACHIDVDVVDDDYGYRATATFVTSRGQLEAHGVARRNPADPQVPVVGGSWRSVGPSRRWPRS